MSQTLQAIQSVKEMPPWLALLIALVPILGGGGVGLNRLDAIQTELAEVHRITETHKFRLNSYQGRLDGLSVKNREQDKRIRESELELARRHDRIYERRNP